MCRDCGVGRDFFTKVDQDGDNKITVEDIKRVMRQRKLPESYATQFISAARGNRWWSNSIKYGTRIINAIIFCAPGLCSLNQAERCFATSLCAIPHI